jgi:hypothetical protein
MVIMVSLSCSPVVQQEAMAGKTESHAANERVGEFIIEAVM